MSSISFEQAKENIDRYREANPNAIRCFWINQDIINFIKATEGLSGIRIYPAMYEDNSLNIILSPTTQGDPGQIDTEYFNYSEPCPPATSNCIGDIGISS